MCKCKAVLNYPAPKWADSIIRGGGQNIRARICIKDKDIKEMKYIYFYDIEDAFMAVPYIQQELRKGNTSIYGGVFEFLKRVYDFDFVSASIEAIGWADIDGKTHYVGLHMRNFTIKGLWITGY